MPEFRHKTHFEENIAAAEIAFSPEEIARLDEEMPHGATAGNRYQDMSSVGL